MSFSLLNFSKELQKIDSHELDKSYQVFIEFTPNLHLKLRQDIYTFLLRCVDLNFAYIDYLEELFNFRNEEEYFRSKDFLLKNKVIMKTDCLALSIYEQNNKLFAEFGTKNT